MSAPDTMSTEPCKTRIGKAMSHYGGDFVRHIGQALLRADYVNEARLRAAFPEYFEQYTEMVRREMEREAQR